MVSRDLFVMFAIVGVLVKYNRYVIIITAYQVVRILQVSLFKRTEAHLKEWSFCFIMIMEDIERIYFRVLSKGATMIKRLQVGKVYNSWNVLDVHVVAHSKKDFLSVNRKVYSANNRRQKTINSVFGLRCPQSLRSFL